MLLCSRYLCLQTQQGLVIICFWMCPFLFFGLATFSVNVFFLAGNKEWLRYGFQRLIVGLSVHWIGFTESEGKSYLCWSVDNTLVVVSWLTVHGRGDYTFTNFTFNESEIRVVIVFFSSLSVYLTWMKRTAQDTKKSLVVFLWKMFRIETFLGLVRISTTNCIVVWQNSYNHSICFLNTNNSVAVYCHLCETL